MTRHHIHCSFEDDDYNDFDDSYFYPMSCFLSPLQVIIGKLTCEWSKEEFGVMMIMMTTMTTMIITIKSMMMEA